MPFRVENIMIEKLNGTTVRMYRNDTPENFPIHWHPPGEIICPIENSYQTNIAGQDLTLLPHDVLIIASGELHTVTAPPTGERYILNFSTPFFEQFQELSRFFPRCTLSNFCATPMLPT